MATPLEQLAASLFGADTQQVIAAENPYYQFGSVPQAFIQGATSQAPKSRSQMWQQALAGSLGGLLGGGLRAYGNQYQNTLTDRYRDAVKIALGGETPTTEAVGYLPQSLFNQSQEVAKVFKLAAAQEALDYQTDVAKAGDMEVQKVADIDKYWASKQAPVEGAAVEGVVPVEGAAAAATGDMGVFTPQGSPNDPYAKREQELRIEKVGAETDLRKEFNMLPEVKNFSIVEKSARIIGQALADDSSVADQELVRYGILLIEPGMAVREGEQAAMANTQAVPDAWKGEMLRALNGQGRLRKETREGLKRLAMRAYDGHKISYDRALTHYRGIATNTGLNPDRLSYIGDLPGSQDLLGGVVVAGSNDVEPTPGEVEAELAKRSR